MFMIRIIYDEYVNNLVYYGHFLYRNWFMSGIKIEGEFICMSVVIRIIIYDEQKTSASILKEKIEQALKFLDTDNEHICLTYSVDLELLKDVKNNEPHLIFINVESDNSIGFEIAKKIKQREVEARIIFTSSNDELVFKTLTYFPYYFLRTKKADKELRLVLSRYLCQLKKEKSFFFQYKINGNIYQINSEEIIYLTYYNHKITLILENDKIEFRGRILDCEAQLQQKCFFKANPGTIINFSHCKNLSRGIFTMCNDDQIIVSRDRKKNAEERFYMHWMQ